MGAIRIAAGTSIIAVAVAATSPEFEATPVVGKALEKASALREALPKTLDTVTAAMRGR